MDIKIFKGTTTESAILEIEAHSKKYHDGLYCDMNNLPERTMVKKGAAEIGDIIKELKASRIKITKANTAAVNKEHDAIVARLVVANKPFTDLLDDYNTERKAILDAEKARKQLILDTEKLLAEHDHAIIMNQVWDLEIDKRAADKEKAIAKHISEIKLREEQAVARAIEQQKAITDAKERDRVNEENARLANKEHIQEVKTGIYKVLVQFGLSSADAKTVIHLATIKELPNLTINY